MRNLAISMVVAGLVMGVQASADPKASLKVDGINSTSGDTSILIKKGDVSAQQCVEYQIVDGSEEVSGDPSMTKSAALRSWKSACADWKSQVKELNKSAQNALMALSCGSSAAVQDGEQWYYRSAGTYKLKVKVREKM